MKPAPMSAEELRAFLVEDLPEHLRETTDIFVLDVSDPRAAKPEKKPSKPRSKQSAGVKKPAAKKSRRRPAPPAA